MALSQAEPMNQENPSSFLGESYGCTLKESIRSLLEEIRTGTADLSRSVDIFYRLMQAKIDPPLESIWVYAALSFHGHKSADEDPFNLLAVAKDLFQLISACSAPCSSPKSIALLAPVLFQMHTLMIGMLAKASSSKKEKKTIREVKALNDVILGYIGVCSSKKLSQESEETDLSLSTQIPDLIRVWTDSNGGLNSFFPLLSLEIRNKLAEGEIDVNYLAGAVISEAFLLKILLNLRFGDMGTDKEEELRSWVVGTLTGFHNIYFFEILVNILLEPTLLETPLLNQKDEIFLRKILYDAVLSVEYSFLDTNYIVAKLPSERMKNLAVTRLILTHEAMEFCRDNKDQKRAISYSNAFSTSRLSSQITKWINVGMQGGANMINGSSPKALLKSLFNLESHGIRVFEDTLLRRRAKLAINDTGAGLAQIGSIPEKNVEADLLFYIDNNNKAEEEKNEEENEEERLDETANSAFVNAAHAIKATDNWGKKRKGKGNVGKKKSVKYVKYDLSAVSDSGKKKNVALAASDDDDSGSDSELEDLKSN